MSTAEQISPPLVSGEKLSQEEFLRRWEALPNLKFAELLEGVVYMPSSLSRAHGIQESAVGFWIAYYAGFTTGCEAGCEAAHQATLAHERFHQLKALRRQAVSTIEAKLGGGGRGIVYRALAP